MGKYWLTAAMAVAMLAPPASVFAQTTPERCALIGPATERLACYDSLFRSGQFTGAGEESADTGLWTSGVEISQIEDTERAYAALQSEQLIPALPSGRGPVRMTIVCEAGEIVVQFSFAGQLMGTPTSNSGLLTIQFDRQPPRSQSLALTPDLKALRFFTSEQANAFIDTLQVTERLFIRAQPQAQRSVTVSFLVAGVEEALAPVREACE